MADLLWASYNYWCVPDYDGQDRCSDSNGFWTVSGIHSRSPENFHELVINGSADSFLAEKYPDLAVSYEKHATRDDVFFHPHPLFSSQLRRKASKAPSGVSPAFCSRLSSYYKWYITSIWSSLNITSQETLVISSELMETVDGLERLWAQLVSKLGTSIGPYDGTTDGRTNYAMMMKRKFHKFARHRVNSNSAQLSASELRSILRPKALKEVGRNNSRGTAGRLHAEALSGHGVYDISGRQPMLAETRAIIDHCWHEECLWLSKVTGYHYRSCST